jgi:hypothetical protein
MTISDVIPDEVKAEFWLTVRDCLVEFHGMASQQSQLGVDELQSSIQSLTDSQEMLFYHSEPFDVACNIARNPLNSDDFLERYLEIRDVKNAGTGAVGSFAQLQTV